MTIQHLNSIEEISNAVANNDVVLIDFWAPWCNPCKAMEPALHETANEMGTVKVVKVNIDSVCSAAEEYQIRGVPTLLLLKNSEEIARKVGSVSKSQILNFITANV